MKYMKMAAIALMALALFSCNNKNNEPKNEVAQLSIRINDAQLRAMMDPAETDAQTLITDNVVLTLDNGEQITLNADEIAQAKGTDGYKKPVTEVVKTVSLVANGKIEKTTDITTLQGKDIATEIALTAPATAVSTTVKDGMTTYEVELSPVPAVARLEVAGKIVGQENKTTHKQAFKDITVEHVYVNNYLSTIIGTRHMCVTNGKDGFAATPVLQKQMNDKIEAGDKEAFEKIEKVAGYYLFPKKDDETASAPDYFDHVILKIKITYTDEALVADPTLAQKTDRYVTIARFMKSATGDLDATGFLAGTIYKLDLGELSKDFKTGDDGKPDPENPDTPDPEPTANKQLVVKVKPYTWTAQNIKPDVNNGYKK
ncbi:hypothetical protein [Porphyromonas sp.]|uniref:hypothetical protein n=1 Tax=Porphyromonas sp. TaxID=1924944 RepID=UPI003991F0C9